MSEPIVVAQNQPLALKRLSAMRVLYASAKQFFTLQLILSLPIVILIAFTALAYDKSWFGLPHKDISWFVGATGILFLLLDILVWTPQINKRREMGAKIQQCFDCTVLDMPWNEIKYGRAPEHEEIETQADKYKHNPNADLLNWYRVEVASVEHPIARILCQRANCWWDMDLRKRYNDIVVAVGAVGILTILCIAIFLNITAETFLALVVAPMLPFLSVGIKLIQDNNDAITRLVAMKEGIDSIWEKVLRGNASFDDLERFSSDLQLGIYNNRKSNPLIFDWLHRRAKPAHEKTLSKSTEQYIADFKQAHPNGYLAS